MATGATAPETPTQKWVASSWWAASAATTLQAWTGESTASPTRARAAAGQGGSVPDEASTADEEAAGNAPTSVIDEAAGSRSVTIVDPGPLGSKFDWRAHFAPEKELTVDGLAVGYQAEKVGTLRPGLVVRTINGVETPGYAESDVMTALRQRPLCVVFSEPKPAPGPAVDVDSVEIDVDEDGDAAQLGLLAADGGGGTVADGTATSPIRPWL